MKFSSSTFQLDLYDDLGRLDDRHELGVDLVAHVLRLERGDPRPRRGHVREGAFHDLADDLLLDRGEVPPLRLDVLHRLAAEEAFDEGEHHRGLDDEERQPFQRLHPEQVDVRGEGERLHEVAELHHRDAVDAHVDEPAQDRRDGVAEGPREPLVRDLEAGHPPADDPLLAAEVELLGPVGSPGVAFGPDVAGLDSL